jgi:hypothetical protein
MTILSAEVVMAKAREATGLHDFGDESFIDGLERNLTALASIPLKNETLRRLETGVIADLAKRLRIEDYHRSHPELDDQVIDGPLVVTGMPRTGTTATVSLLALDPRFRFMRAWEGRSPVPPPELDTEADDPRAVAARAVVQSAAMAAMHLSDPDGPEEDMFLLAGLTCASYRGDLPMPQDYLDWWMNNDFASTYAYTQRVLKLLQSKRPPNRWLIKSPPHFFKMRAIAKEFPNARFIMTHRNLESVLSSNASFTDALYQGACTEGSYVLDKKWIGERCLWFWAEGARRALADRAAIGEDRYIDVHNSDIVRAPVETLQAVYDQLGMSVSDELRRRWTTFQIENAKGASGGHEHRLEDYDLSPSIIRGAFKDYCERFGV